MHDIVFTIIICSFNILWLVVIELLNVVPDGSDLEHELLPELFIDDEAFLVVADSELVFLVHGIAVEETSSSKAREIFAVGVASEDEAFCTETKRLVWIVIHTSTFAHLVVAKAQCLARHIRDQSFTKTKARFDINFLII